MGSGAKTCTPKSAKTCFLGLVKDWRGRAGVRFSLRCLALAPADADRVLAGLSESIACPKGVLEMPLLPVKVLQHAGRRQVM